MFEAFTGWRIAVELTDTGGPYVIVPGPNNELGRE